MCGLRRSARNFEMSDPYATPNTPAGIPPQRKPRLRILKHLLAFSVIFAVLNFFGSSEGDVDLPQVSIFARVITLALFYGIGYALFSRVRARR
jgi:hypothetical protein